MTNRRSDPAHPTVLVALIVVQSICAAIFFGDIVADLMFPDPQKTEGQHAYLEAIATFGLIAAIVIEGRILMWLLRRKAHLETSLRNAQGAIEEVIDAEFSSWKLTPAEQDVATFLVKGLSTGEIAQMRGSAEGTVKAQLNAIYRKSGSSNRAELMSLLIDTLMGQRVSPDLPDQP
ncbi:MAG: helix-turn-helix transcriptional regulator [Roseobacter sp. MedPE-SWde]|nr:MAG: helix-turn-helix transcriptional regulator [Roseobacter sp. MedPE-SWde]